MTPTPPSSPDGSPLPPRHRPTLGNLAKDTTELDLWAFEDDLDLAGEQEEPRAEERAARSSGKEIPAPRERQVSKPRENDDKVPKTPAGNEDRIRMNVSKARSGSKPSGSTSPQSKPESDFDDLDHWEDAKVETEIGELPAEVPLSREPQVSTPMAAMPVPAELEPLPEVSAPPLEAPPVAQAIAQPQDPLDEFSPVVSVDAKPISLRPHLGLSKIERIGLITLMVLLLGGALTILIYSLNRLPTESHKAEAQDFPIKGTHISIRSAKSFWRMPVTDGPNPDVCRRGTQLLPVLELDLASAAPAAVRILFRNDELSLVGDAVTHAVRGDGKLSIAATAGFDDLGMYAAYRAGESKSWTIEVYEAPTEDTAGREFKKLFEMEITTDRR
jgi:hypothetical protein